MCLAIPGKVIKLNEEVGEVEVFGVIKQVSFLLCPDAGVGDYVLVHAGFAIQVIDEAQALETLALIKEWEEHEASSGI
ncbi:MAG: HypC/HybG/HupF family hydrogenase formation chaperone [Clostridia bacterium]|nr:HypC/HybG/HupF family hydrogenase formation chaperone [Clostridia bacterium]